MHAISVAIYAVLIEKDRELYLMVLHMLFKYGERLSVILPVRWAVVYFDYYKTIIGKLLLPFG